MRDSAPCWYPGARVYFISPLCPEPPRTSHAFTIVAENCLLSVCPTLGCKANLSEFSLYLFKEAGNPGFRAFPVLTARRPFSAPDCRWICRIDFLLLQIGILCPPAAFCCLCPSWFPKGATRVLSALIVFMSEVKFMCSGDFSVCSLCSLAAVCRVSCVFPLPFLP